MTETSYDSCLSCWLCSFSCLCFGVEIWSFKRQKPLLCFQLVAAYVMTIILIVVLVIPYCMTCFCSLIIAFILHLFLFLYNLCLKFKSWDCHSEIKIKIITLLENPFYKLAALNKKLEHASRFYVSYRLLLFRIQGYTSLFPDIKMFPFYTNLN